MVALVGVGLLGLAMYVNLAPKAAGGFAVEDAFVKFVTRAVGLGVFEQSVIVDVLFAAGQVEAVECGFAAFAGQEGVDIVARQTPAQRNGGRGELAGARRADLHIGQVERQYAYFLVPPQLVKKERLNHIHLSMW